MTKKIIRITEEDLGKVVKDDIENLQKWHWVEVSNPLEKCFKD